MIHITHCCYKSIDENDTYCPGCGKISDSLRLSDMLDELRKRQPPVTGNGLTEAQIERLAIVSQECGEVVQIIGKILLHGYNNLDYDNRKLLELELGDVIFGMHLMASAGDISKRDVYIYADAKLPKIVRYLRHQGDIHEIDLAMQRI